MPRPHLIRSDAFAYHVSVRSNNKEWFYIPLLECWNILCSALGDASFRRGAQLHSLVLMSNHLHLLISTPRRNLDEVMQLFLTNSSRRIQRRAGRINHVFGARYKPSILSSGLVFAYVYKYVYRNPVRSGICRSVEEYPFSTLNTLPRDMPLVRGITEYWKWIPTDPTELIDWLNKPTAKEQEELVGRAMRRYEFKFTTNQNDQGNLAKLKHAYAVEGVEGGESRLLY